ncbi:hypothetical protein AO260_30145 [Pseudomonas sp. ABAC21]|nr:hypothetical protein AO260_30145 [Pseudomonas sp. ABAC21]
MVIHESIHSSIYKSRDNFSTNHREPSANFHTLNFIDELILLLVAKDKTQYFKYLIPLKDNPALTNQSHQPLH